MRSNKKTTKSTKKIKEIIAKEYNKKKQELSLGRIRL